MRSGFPGLHHPFPPRSSHSLSSVASTSRDQRQSGPRRGVGRVQRQIPTVALFRLFQAPGIQKGLSRSPRRIHGQTKVGEGDEADPPPGCRFGVFDAGPLDPLLAGYYAASSDFRRSGESTLSNHPTITTTTAPTTL